MSSFLDVAMCNRPLDNEELGIPEESDLMQSLDNQAKSGIFEDIKRAFISTQDENHENIFAKNTGLNIFVSNVIDDKQGIIDSLSKVIDQKLDTIDERLYKVDELIDKFARCKSENEQLKSKLTNLRDENYVLKNELGKFSRVVFGVFFRK